MFNQALIQEWVSELTQSLPRLDGVQTELSETLDVLLKRLLQKMNLVTREEWDIQSEVLARTRQRLEILEKRVAALEAAANLPQFEGVKK